MCATGSAGAEASNAVWTATWRSSTWRSSGPGLAAGIGWRCGGRYMTSPRIGSPACARWTRICGSVAAQCVSSVTVASQGG
eukprot:191560-Prorocentrum_minimum.AAC.1